MKQISKLMLAAVASVALAAPAFAWDFSASGSAAAYFNQTTVKASKDSNALTGGGVSSEGGGITLSSSHTDGPKSVSMSYAVDWADAGLDETLSVSGSAKVGNWTASAGTSFNLDRYGCSDNTSTAVSRCGQQSGEDTTAVTITDGTMTIVLGDASHLSSQNVSSGSTAGGSVSFDSADDDASVGAFVGGYNGVSLGYKISDTMSVTVAYQASSDTGDACGAGEGYDSEIAGQHGITGTGFGFNGTFGTIGVGLTICNAATADKGTATTAGGSSGTSTSTMGLGVAMDLGDIDPFISFGTYLGVGNDSKSGAAYAGNEIGLTYALGNDTVILYTGSVSEIDTTASVAGEAKTTTGLELGYNTAVGPAALAVGYGSKTIAQTGGTSDGYAYTDIEVALSYSF
ncbi:uncharacterized protein METZ01_LOCUS248068 [marine metagenome]|uniref:Porin domain-containing protein n=1 Tax=marine metagenome TaxID=408172 RepID=A0A382I684_9ZZZZ